MKDSFHFIGIGGIGMSALAHILLQKGSAVSGSDIAKSDVIESLKQSGAQIFRGHNACHICSQKKVVYSSIIFEDNEEMVAAKKLGIPLLHRSDLLNELTLGKKSICIAGTHGKTTTTALISHLLVQSGFDPSYVVGGIAPSLSANGYCGTGDYFVLESDESDASFLKTKPFAAIITNIEPDHLNYWGTFEALKEGFKKFASLSLNLVFCEEDPVLKEMKLQGTSYGFRNISNIQKMERGSYFTLEGHRFFTPLLGDHNILNTVGALTLCLKLGVDPLDLQKALPLFRGVGRRLEWIKTENGVSYYDDYAHHPTEIKATLSALKNRGRVICIFQAHRYSRTKALMKEFGDVLSQIPYLILLPIYGVDEKEDKDVFEKLCDVAKPKHVVRKEDISLFLKELVKEGDSVITLGAGDVTHVLR